MPRPDNLEVTQEQLDTLNHSAYNGCLVPIVVTEQGVLLVQDQGVASWPIKVITTLGIVFPFWQYYELEKDIRTNSSSY